MRAQPGIAVIAPADPQQARTAVQQTWNLDGPIYYRLGRLDQLVVPNLEGRFELGRAQLIRDGKDVLIVTMGTIAIEAVAAAENLSKKGISAAVLVVASVNPPPTQDLIETISKFSSVITVEAHYKNGGLGSLVCETVACNGLNTRILRCAVEHTPDGKTGGLDYLYRSNGLSADCLEATALHTLALSK
jgi:transketolase